MDGLIDHRYKVLRVLGAGLSGEVLAVQDHEGQKALKTLKRVQLNVSKDETLKNFKNEFSILSELNHPNIARILDFGFDARINKYYFTTELIEGQDFFAATENLTAEEIEEVAVQVLRALNYLHSRGIYHFDIKPQNILVAQKDGRPWAKIIDFGLAGFSSPRRKVGTPAYMAPEVILGGNLDGRTDLYSFGVLLYKSLTRENPFANKQISETLNRHRNLVPELPSLIKANTPKFWDRILPRLLEKNPTDRYPQASAVIRDINFLNNRKFDIETIDTRLSYLPEKGNLIGREKEMAAFKNLFEVTFNSGDWASGQLMIIEGASGTGKSRFLNECKYYSQLHDIPVHLLKTLAESPELKPPFCLIVDESEPVAPEKISELLQHYASEKVLLLWITEKAPEGWSHCEILTLKDFSKENLKDYLTMVTGLTDPPAKLVSEIYARTEGNPLFVTELLKTMLADNWLLDASGRWASATFDAIEIKFDAIEVPKTIGGLLLKKFAALNAPAQEILKWLSVMNQPASLDTLKRLTQLEHPQGTILTLTREGFIERTDREHHYFFSNVLLRDALYQWLGAPEREGKHDTLADFYAEQTQSEALTLFHKGRGSRAIAAVEALWELSELELKNESNTKAVETLRQAHKRSLELSLEIQSLTEEKWAAALAQARRLKEATIHYQNLKKIIDTQEINVNFEKKIHVYEKLGDLYAKQDQYKQALELFQTALTWLDQLPEARVERMLIENDIGNIYLKTGKTDEALVLFQKNHDQWASDFSENEQNRITNNYLATAFEIKQSFDAALKQLEINIAFFERIQNLYLKARALYIRADINYKLMLGSTDTKMNEHKAAALATFQECITIAKQIDAFDLMMRAYNGLGNLFYYDKDLEGSTNNYQKALALARKSEDYLTAATIAKNLGNIYTTEKKFRDAYAYFVYAINTLEGFENKTSFVYELLFTCHAEIGEAYMELGELDRAEESFNKAADIMTHHDHLAHFEFWIWLQRAKLYHKQKHRSLFRDSLRKAQLLAKEGLEAQSLAQFKASLKNEPDLLNEPDETETNPPQGSSGPALENQWENIIKINRLLNSEHNLDHLLKMVLNFALELTDAESGLVILINDKKELEVRASINEVLSDELTKFSRSIATECIQKGDVIITDAHLDERFAGNESIILNELKSILCLPLKSRNRIIGVLYLDNRYKTDAFKSVNSRLLHAYADQVGIALENARLMNQYQEAQKQLKTKLHQTEDELSEVKEILKSENSISMNLYSYEHIIGRSKIMRDIFKVLDKVTETTLAIFLHGASGTGKELIARAIHFNNTDRCHKRFVPINCAAIPANLMESELFGYKMGSFTGASRDKKGLFEEANGGTLFLDEVADLEPQLQVKLLRVLQEGEVQRIGDVQTIKVDVRIVSASHHSLDDMVAGGRFREDLYYRLCQMKISLPTLAERKEDIPVLMQHFIDSYCTKNKVPDGIAVDVDLMKALFAYPWPGNIRELENTLQVACALREGNKITLNSLPQNHGLLQYTQTHPPVNPTSESSKDQQIIPVTSNIKIDETNYLNPQKTWQDYEKLIIAKCYAHNKFQKNITSPMLGLSPATLHNKIKAFKLDDQNQLIYQEPFDYQPGNTLKHYIPLVFKAALDYAGNHPYAAIKQLNVSQGYFYKIIKTS